MMDWTDRHCRVFHRQALRPGALQQDKSGFDDPFPYRIDHAVLHDYTKYTPAV